MAHNITNASLENIYERLHNAPEYHPLDANTFSDWSVEAGDIVSVSRGEDSYETPVHTAKLVWKGAPEITLSSTGNKERDAVSKMSRKKYGRGGTAVRSQEKIYYEFTSSDGYLHSAIYMSESVLRTEFDNAISDVHSTIIQTAEQIYSEIYASDSMLFSYVDQTATYISSHVEDVANSLGSEILQTASQIRAEVHASDSALYSYVDQTATYIQSVVEDTANSLGSAILQTASQIRSEVHASNSELYSYVDQTATYIQSVVEDTANDLGSTILQTASQIRSEVHAADSTLYSYVNQTASGIRQEVANTASGLQSIITQQANKISLVVDSSNHIKAAEIAASINQQTGQSTVVLSADIIDIDGLVEKLESKYVETTGLTTTYLTPSVIDLQDTTIESTYSQVNAGKLVVSVSKNDITGEVTLTQLDGTTTTFSRAVPGGDKISGSWGGATLTVGKSTVGADTFTSFISTGFVTDTNVSPNTYHITAYRQDNGAQQPTEIQAARLQYKLGVLSNSKTTVRILNSAGTSFINGTASYSIPLTTLTATSNGTYSPSGNNVGYSSVTVNVPSDLTRARVRFSGSSGQYYYEAYDSSTGNSISGSSVTYHLGLSGTKVQIQNSSNTKISGTQEYTIPLTTRTITSNGTYSPSSSYVGYSSVTVNNPYSVASFNTTSPSGQTYNTYTNNSSGYDLYGTGTSARAYIVIKGTWTCDGVSQTGTNYLGSSPTALYRKGFSDGQANAPHVISNFDVTAPDGASSGGHTNNSSGYSIEGTGSDAKAYIVVQGSWKCDGVSKDGTAYLSNAPTNLYKKGLSDGRASTPYTVSSFTTTAPSGQTYGSYSNGPDGYYLSGTGTSAYAVIVVKGTWKCDGNDQDSTNYLAGAPTELYKQGYRDGLAGAPHSVTSFSTYANKDYEYGGHKNGENGYSVTNTGVAATVYMVVKGTWNCDGVSREAYNYLSGAPTELYHEAYRAGLADGKNAVSLDSEFSWSNTPTTGSTNPSSNHNKISISTTGRPSPVTRSLDLYLDSGSWSSGSRTITLYYTKNNTTYKVSKQTVSNSSWTFGSISGYSSSQSKDVERTVTAGYKYWTFTVKVNGQTKTVQIVVSS